MNRAVIVALVCAFGSALLAGCSTSTPQAEEAKLRIANPPTVFVLPGDTSANTEPDVPVYFDAPPYDAWQFTLVPEGLTATPGTASEEFRTPPSITAPLEGVYMVELENSSTGENWQVKLFVASDAGSPSP